MTADRELAGAHLADFRATKRAMLRDVASEKLTLKTVVERLRRRYDVLLKRFLRAEGTTYGTWAEHGPKVELDELLEAARDQATWDRLVETYEQRFAQP